MAGFAIWGVEEAGLPTFGIYHFCLKAAPAQSSLCIIKFRVLGFRVLELRVFGLGFRV